MEWELAHKESWALQNWCFELRFWRRLLRVPWTARRSNQSILKEISPEYSLEELILKLKLQYFGLLMRRTDSLEKTLMLVKIEGRRMDDRGWDGLMASPTWWTCSNASSGSRWWTGKPGVLQSMGFQTQLSIWTELTMWSFHSLSSDHLTLFICKSFSLEKEMATYSSILAWKIPWMEEPDRLQSMGLQSQTWLSDFTFTFLDKQNRIFRVLLSLYHASAVYLQYQKADLSPFHLCWSKYNFKHPESSLAILASLCSFFHWLLL